MTAITFGYGTHVGSVRTRNEDSYGFDATTQIWVVADGMGGHPSGDVASQIVTEHVVSSFKSGVSLEECVAGAHQAILDAPSKGIGHPTMGSTVVALSISENRYKIAWVGDSRAYLWDGEALQRLSRDHSMVQEIMDYGVLSEDEAKQLPFNGMLTRTLGIESTTNIEVDAVEGEFKPGEEILLCSDGLTNEVSEETISEVLAAKASAQVKVNELIHNALSNRGNDNITAILVDAD